MKTELTVSRLPFLPLLGWTAVLASLVGLAGQMYGAPRIGLPLALVGLLGGTFALLGRHRA